MPFQRIGHSLAAGISINTLDTGPDRPHKTPPQSEGKNACRPHSSIPADLTLRSVVGPIRAREATRGFGLDREPVPLRGVEHGIGTGPAQRSADPGKQRGIFQLGNVLRLTDTQIDAEQDLFTDVVEGVPRGLVGEGEGRSGRDLACDGYIPTISPGCVDRRQALPGPEHAKAKPVLSTQEPGLLKIRAQLPSRSVESIPCLLAADLDARLAAREALCELLRAEVAQPATEGQRPCVAEEIPVGPTGLDLEAFGRRQAESKPDALCIGLADLNLDIDQGIRWLDALRDVNEVEQRHRVKGSLAADDLIFSVDLAAAERQYPQHIVL